jgi:hypothetical protein
LLKENYSKQGMINQDKNWNWSLMLLLEISILIIVTLITWS